MRPLVSAVLITRNRLPLLQKAVGSVLSQTWQDLELIIVDDASTDGTENWLTDFASSHPVMILRTSEASGANHARNLGIRQATGEYIALLDDDDLWLPEKTERQVNYLLSHPDCGVVSCARIAEYVSGLYETEPPEILPEGDLHQRIFSDLHFTSSRLMIQKSLLLQAGLFDESLPAWQDFELMIRLSQLTHIGVVRDNLVQYHISASDPGRISNRMDAWQRAVKQIHKKHAALLASLPEDALREHRLMICREGAARAERAGLPRIKRRYLLKQFLLNPDRGNLKRVLLNRR